jgi:hypothetical protein
MRKLILLVVALFGGCSSPDEQQKNAIGLNDAVSACITEEVLREYNATEKDIRDFKEAGAKRGTATEATCG